jgi:hypothetical protein
MDFVLICVFIHPVKRRESPIINPRLKKTFTIYDKAPLMWPELESTHEDLGAHLPGSFTLNPTHI